MAGAADSGIQPGQWFQQNRIVWEVDQFASFNGIPHVRISQVRDHTERKLISVRTFRDSYKLAPEQGSKLSITA